MSDAWNRLGQQTQSLKSNASVSGNHSGMGNQGPVTFARPNNTLSGGATLPALNQIKTPQRSVPIRRSSGVR